MEPSFHWQHKCQPRVVRCMYSQPLWTAFCSLSLIAVWSLSMPTKHSSSKYTFPSPSHWIHIACAVMFAVNGVTSPSGNLMSYSCVTKMGLSDWQPIGLPSRSKFCAFTVPHINWLPHGSITDACTYSSPTSGVTSSSKSQNVVSLWSSSEYGKYSKVSGIPTSSSLARVSFAPRCS